MPKHAAGSVISLKTRKKLTKDLLAELKGRGRVVAFRKNALILSEGDNAEFLPVVLAGKVKMLHLLASGKELIIDIFEAGEAFAVPPVFDGKRYPASAAAMEDAELLLISRGDFLELLRHSPDFSLYVINWMCEMLREKTATIQNLAIQSPEVRVVNILRVLVDKLGGPLPVTIGLRRRDIADMAGLTTETTIRVVRRLANQGVFDIAHGKIVISEPGRLESFSDQR